MADVSVGGHCLGEEEEGDSVATAPRVDSKQLHACGSTEDVVAPKSERPGPSCLPDDRGANSDIKCDPKSLETPARPPGDEAAGGGACAVGESPAPLPSPELLGAQKPFHLGAKNLYSMYDAIELRVDLSGKDTPRCNETAESREERERDKVGKAVPDFINPKESFCTPGKEDILSQDEQKPLDRPEHYPESSSKCSSYELPYELKNAEEAKGQGKYRPETAAAVKPSEKAREKRAVKRQEKVDKEESTVSYEFVDDKIFPNSNVPHSVRVSRPHVQVLAEDRKFPARNALLPKPNEKNDIFGRGNEKKTFSLDQVLSRILHNEVFEDTSFPRTESKSNTTCTEGFYDKRQRTSKTTVQCSREIETPNIDTQNKERNDSEDKCLSLHQSKEKPTTSTMGERKTRTPQENEDSFHREENEESPLQSRDLATQLAVSSLGQAKDPVQQLADSGQPPDQWQQVTPEPAVGLESFKRADQEVGIEHEASFCNHEEGAEKLAIYTDVHDEDREKSCQENCDTLPMLPPSQTHRESLNPTPQNTSKAGKLGSVGQTADVESTVLVDISQTSPGSSDYNLKTSDGLEQLLFHGDTILGVQPESHGTHSLRDASETNSTDLELDPVDRIVNFANADNDSAGNTPEFTETDFLSIGDQPATGPKTFTNLQAEAHSDDGMPTGQEHTVTPHDPTPPLDKKTEAVFAEPEKESMHFEERESQSIRCSLDSSLPCDAEEDQRQLDNDDLPQRKQRLMHDLVALGGQVGHFSERCSEKNFEYDKASQIDCQNQRKQRNLVKSAGKVEAKVFDTKKHLEFLSADGNGSIPDRSVQLDNDISDESSSNSVADINSFADQQMTKEKHRGTAEEHKRGLSSGSEGSDVTHRYSECLIFQYNKSGIIRWRLEQGGDRENTRTIHFRSTHLDTPSGPETSFTEHLQPLKGNVPGTDTHESSQPGRYLLLREVWDLKLRMKKMCAEFFQHKNLTAPKKHFPLKDREEPLKFLMKLLMLDVLHDAKDPRCERYCLQSYCPLHSESLRTNTVTVCPVFPPRDPERFHVPPPTAPHPPVAAGEIVGPDAHEEGPQVAPRLPHHGAPHGLQRPPYSLQRAGRAAAGEDRLPRRRILYRGQPCRCAQCLMVHWRANIGLPAVAVPYPTICQDDFNSDLYAGVTSQIFIAPFVHEPGASAARPYEVPRLPGPTRQIFGQDFTRCRLRAEENPACLNCLKVHFRPNDSASAEEQSCSHFTSSTQVTVEEDFDVQGQRLLQQNGDAPQHRLCMLCGRRVVHTTLFNCHHRVLCKQCARFVQLCPTCGEFVVCFSVP